MKQWKWQRAICKVRDGNFPGVFNKEIWIEVGKPQYIEGVIFNGRPMYVEGFFTNLITWDNEATCCIDRRRVEFLARDPKDLADNVPLIPYEEWSNWK